MTKTYKFTKINARKAAHGFKCYIGSPESIVAAGEGIKYAQQLQPGITIEVNTNYSNCEVKVYTDDDSVARAFADAFVGET